MSIKRKKVKCHECAQNCFCGSSERMEQNHFAGHNHAPELFIPFCGDDHDQFHINCRRAGVDFNYTPNKALALVQAIKAMLVGFWMVIQKLEKHLKDQS